MPSHARNHFNHHSALRLATDSPVTRQDLNAYEQMLSKLNEDKRRLKDIQSIERKIEVKRELLPDYMAWCKGVISGNKAVQDDVLMTALVWCIDTNSFDDALSLSEYALKHNLVLPDQFNRDLPTLLCEEVAEQSLKLLNGNGDCKAERILMTLLKTDLMTSGKDMPDEVRAKLFKAIGYAHRESDSPHEAIAALKRALDLHDKVGVKKDIERLEVVVKNLSDMDDN